MVFHAQKNKKHSRVKVVKPKLFQEERGRRQQTNICLLSGASPKVSTAGYESTVLSFLLATKLLTVASLSWFRTHACMLLICTNHLISKSAHILKSPMQGRHSQRQISHESATINSGFYQNRPCCLLNCQQPLKILMEKGY